MLCRLLCVICHTHTPFKTHKHRLKHVYFEYDTMHTGPGQWVVTIFKLTKCISIDIDRYLYMFLFQSIPASYIPMFNVVLLHLLLAP